MEGGWWEVEGGRRKVGGRWWEVEVGGGAREHWTSESIIGLDILVPRWPVASFQEITDFVDDPLCVP